MFNKAVLGDGAAYCENGRKKMACAYRKVKPVVLVGGLGHHSPCGSLCDRLTERHDRVGDSDLSSTHEVVLQILQADFQMQLSSSGNDMLTGLLCGTHDHGIRLG